MHSQCALAAALAAVAGARNFSVLLVPPPPSSSGRPAGRLAGLFPLLLSPGSVAAVRLLLSWLMGPRAAAAAAAAAALVSHVAAVLVDLAVLSAAGLVARAGEAERRGIKRR